MGEGGAVVGRLAPSPTGKLHLGHARSFLLAWWSARSQGGAVRLRLEDLDRQRSRPEWTDLCLRDLEWLGLDWDGAVLHQSADLEPYREALARLEADGRVYPCVCSRRDIQAAVSAPHTQDARYPGTCAGRFASPAAAQAATGAAPGLRFRTPPGPVELEDRFQGRFTTDVAEEVGDFLLARRDGVTAYQLAVVVDDERQGVTEVVRGSDLLSSTPRQWLLQEALGFPHPTWIHVPLVQGDDGERLAKRRDDLSLVSLREAGVDPRAIVQWVATTCGMVAPDLGTPVDFLPQFDLERLSREPVRFGAVERNRLLPADRP